MTYKYLDSAVKSIEYYLNSAYSHGYSDGKEDARIEYSKHGKIVKMEVLSEDDYSSMPEYYKSWPVKAWCSCGKPLNRIDYTFCPYCGGLIVRRGKKERTLKNFRKNTISAGLTLKKLNHQVLKKNMQVTN